MQLVRIDAIGNVTATLASTAVSGGRYSFNLASLGLAPASDLAVRVVNSGTGVQLRAFVTGPTVNLDPTSETAVRLVLEQIVLTPGTTLKQFTISELRDIEGAVDQLVTVKQVVAGHSIEATVSAIKAAVAGEAGLTGFVVAAAGPGETPAGPGDIGNYVPLVQGRFWQFQGTHSETNQPTIQYINTVAVGGSKAVGTVTTTILTESRQPDSGPVLEVYYLKDSRGVWNYGDNSIVDLLNSPLLPHRVLLFPFHLGLSSDIVNKQGLDFGRDLDSDGKNETANLHSQVTIEAFEAVTVPKGRFTNAARAVTITTLTLFSSAGFGSRTAVTTQTIWFAPGVGPVKRMTVIQADGGFQATSTEELIDYGTDGLVVRQVALAANDLMYDPKTQKIYASVPGNPGSIRSIDPTTGDIGPGISVGSQPKKLALSGNGQYLYFGLDGEGAFQRLDLASQTPSPKFSLGSDPFLGPHYVEDIEVIPGSPGSVAISRRYSGVIPQHAGVAIYDNGVLRPTTTPGHTGSNVIEFSASPTRLYGQNLETTEFGFRRMIVDSSGVKVQDVFDSFMGDLVSGFGVDIKFEAGRIYTTSGRVIDPEARTVVGTFVLPSSSGNLVKPDATLGRVFYLTQEGTSGTWKLLAFDMNSRQLLGSETMTGLTGTPDSLIRWGAKGLAFRTTDGKVFLVSSANLIP